jgi:cell division protein FtsI/penicillin-binding protein 2
MKRVLTKKPTFSLYAWRIKALWFFILLLGLVIIGRLFWLQVIKYQDYLHLAAVQHDVSQEILPERGIIYTQDTRVTSGEPKLFPVANNQTFYLIYGQPYAVVNPEETAKQMNSVLDLPEEVVKKIIEQISKFNDPYEPLVHRVTEEKIAKIKDLNLPGIKWEKESLRYYPEKIIGSNVIGFVGWQNDKLVGQYGIEGYFDQQLAGQKGFLESERDATGRLISVGDQNYQPAVNGSDIILTIDNSIQAVACQKLDEGVKKYDADGGAVVIMNPKTGAILAMCGNPDYDPNAYNEVKDIRAYTNPAIFDPYEPGSVFKPLTMAAALDQEKVTPETTYEDKGEERIGGFTIKNSDLQAHGTTTMIDVLKKSLNLGAIFVMRQIGPEVFRQYMEKFGFGQLSGIQLDTEMPGTIDSLKQKGEIYAATASFGQGVMVTPLQLVQAFGALANDGVMMKPYIVDQLIDPTKKVTKNQPQVVRPVVSSRAANLDTGMMVEVVQEGYGKKAGVEGYYIAGKTGTAQVAEKGTGQYGSRTMHTFIGFGPVSDPLFVMVVRLDNPTSARFAESTSTPLFHDIAKFIFNYYQVKPDKINQ